MASFVGSSILAYEACQYRRRVEKDGMMRVAEVIERKKQLQEQRLAERRERHVRAQEEAAAAAAAEKAKKSSWW